MLERNTERFVQKGEACYNLGISRATFDRWRKLPDFPKSHNPNPRGRCLFKLSELFDWMAHRPERL
jgi:predicted DNA-binding transcriptional regulator AlpA